MAQPFTFQLRDQLGHLLGSVAARLRLTSGTERPLPAEAEPFALGPERAESAVLLVHGFTGTPFEMRGLGEALSSRGHRAVGIALAGHAGMTADLGRTRWPDWLASVESAYLELRQAHARVGVAGLSLGGLLALELAWRHSGSEGRPTRVDSLALLSTALRLTEQATRFTRRIREVPWLGQQALPKLAGSDIGDPSMRARNNRAQRGGAMPLPALYSLVDFGDHVRAHLGEVTTPAFVAHGRLDATIPFACQAELLRTIGTPPAALTALVLERSRHVITLDVERQVLYRAVAEHFDRTLARKPQ